MLRGRQVRPWMSRTWATYEAGAERAGRDRPLRGYGVLLSAYGGLLAAGVAMVHRRGGGRERLPAGDLALLAVATFRVSRTLAKDAVAAPLRAPFTTYQGRGGPGEVMEAPRPGPVRHAVGELVTCPFCLTQWVATVGIFASALTPRATRWVTAGMTAVAAADGLHLAYARLQQAAQ